MLRYWLSRRVRWLAVLFALTIGFVEESKGQSLDPDVRLLPAGAAAAATGLFGSRELADSSLAALPQWVSLLQRWANERTTISACDADPNSCGSIRLAYWRAMIRNLRSQPQEAQLAQVNAYINELVQYEPDTVGFGRSDYWADPLETLQGVGDCEDLAALKFFSLLELGFTNEQMRIVVLRDVRRDLGHAVLAVSFNGQEIILDNLRTSPAADYQFPDYVPQYSVNMNTRWAHLPSATMLAQLAG